MSPLWSDKALAQAAWANAVASGLVDESAQDRDRSRDKRLERVRRMPQPRLHSCAL